MSPSRKENVAVLSFWSSFMRPPGSFELFVFHEGWCFGILNCDCRICWRLAGGFLCWAGGGLPSDSFPSHGDTVIAEAWFEVVLGNGRERSRGRSRRQD